MVPEESERWAMVIGVLGSLTPGVVSAAIAGSFHFVILAWKMSAMTGASSFRLLDARQVVRDRDRADQDGEVEAPSCP